MQAPYRTKSKRQASKQCPDKNSMKANRYLRLAHPRYFVRLRRINLTDTYNCVEVNAPRREIAIEAAIIPRFQCGSSCRRAPSPAAAAAAASMVSTGLLCCSLRLADRRSRVYPNVIGSAYLPNLFVRKTFVLEVGRIAFAAPK
ncbi:unnamed protein product [Sphagnum balticum]